MKSAGFILGVNMARNVLDPSHPSSDVLRDYIVTDLQGGLVGVDEDIDFDYTQDVIDGIHDGVRFLNLRMLRIPNVAELVASVQEMINPQKNDDEEEEEEDDDDDSETESGSTSKTKEGSS